MMALNIKVREHEQKRFKLLGILACLDGFMNIVLEQAEEIENGEPGNKYGDAFFRGNNGKHFPFFLW
jgi:small nuclear ribonucleoprotein (snRNP)-like protein